MENRCTINYNRIAEAINYLKQHFKDQPNLGKVASIVHLSPHHFQRLFTEWAGTSPKKFLQYISIEHAKSILAQKATLSETAHQTGLSGTGRLHDLFIKIEGMTPAEYKNGGASLQISYAFYETIFGKIIMASTPKGLCYAAFTDNKAAAFETLKAEFPQAKFENKKDKMHEKALAVFLHKKNIAQIKLHLKGTDFQIKIWNALLKIPSGSLATYGKIAENTGSPMAARAVGTAIGSNPVAYLIPCHRVIRSSGQFGEYMWSSTRKTAIIGWEMSNNAVLDEF